MGSRPVAHIAARNSGIRAKDAPADSAGGLARKTYLRRGPRCMLSSDVWQEWRLYNGAIGEVLDIIYRPGERPSRSLHACILVAFTKYCGPAFPPGLPTVVPVAPIERIMDCRRRYSRTTIPLIPAWGITFRKSQGMTCGSGRDAECVVVHPSKPSFEKSRPRDLYTAFSRAKSAGRGVYGDHWFAPSAL